MTLLGARQEIYTNQFLMLQKFAYATVSKTGDDIKMYVPVSHADVYEGVQV